MKIMILGGSGCVGSHLTRRLSRDGQSISVVTQRNTGAEAPSLGQVVERVAQQRKIRRLIMALTRRTRKTL